MPEFDRAWRRQRDLKERYLPPGENQRCKADELCEQQKLVGQGLCDRHYRMKRIYGRTTRITRKWGEGSITSDGSIVLTVNGKQVREHILLAEKALGRKLPEGAVIHHVTEDPADNHGPFKLVICPNQAYHMFIHKRMRDLGISFETGWPNEEQLKRDE